MPKLTQAGSRLLDDDPVVFAGAWMALLQDAITGQGQELASEVGAITPARCVSVFLAIAKHQPVTIAELARWHGFSHQLMSNRIAELMREGLVRSLPSRQDKRKQALQLTRRGKADLRMVETVCKRSRLGLSSAFAEAGIEANALPKLLRALQRQTLRERSHDLKPQA
jgi:DNA-binding MarR family transcriptional regulator